MLEKIIIPIVVTVATEVAKELVKNSDTKY